MTVLFALVPSLVALVIFVGTFRLQPPRIESRPQSPAQIQARRAPRALRTPLPVGAVRRNTVGSELRA